MPLTICIKNLFVDRLNLVGLPSLVVDVSNGKDAPLSIKEEFTGQGSKKPFQLGLSSLSSVDIFMIIPVFGYSSLRLCLRNYDDLLLL